MGGLSPCSHMISLRPFVHPICQDVLFRPCFQVTLASTPLVFNTNIDFGGSISYMRPSITAGSLRLNGTAASAVYGVSALPLALQAGPQWIAFDGENFGSALSNTTKIYYSKMPDRNENVIVQPIKGEAPIAIAIWYECKRWAQDFSWAISKLQATNLQYTNMSPADAAADLPSKAAIAAGRRLFQANVLSNDAKANFANASVSDHEMIVCQTAGGEEPGNYYFLVDQGGLLSRNPLNLGSAFDLVTFVPPMEIHSISGKNSNLCCRRTAPPHDVVVSMLKTPVWLHTWISPAT
jgi:hypothetical protein